MKPRIPLAHVSSDVAGYWREHPVDIHLRSVAERAAANASVFGEPEWAGLAGLWHDLGKYQPTFQDHIRLASGMEAHVETAPGKVRHAIAGAIHAVDNLNAYGSLLAYIIAGHHAGLPDWNPIEGGGASLAQELAEQRETLTGTIAGNPPPDILFPSPRLPKPHIREKNQLHLWLRMLFSCVVDADFLDTEAFFDQGRSVLRGGYPGLPALRDAYDRDVIARFSGMDTPISRIRTEVREACINHAQDAPGLFSLTVPTGGGKTLASLGFALHHAEKHGFRRIIYVIPYTSIIEQTADVFREIFTAIKPLPVIEHHSNLEPEKETAKGRIAAENWDAPIVVTTNVQFLESLYAAKPSRCRKLHNISGSVVILDEAQLLPPEQLAPVIDALRQLIALYGVTVVLSTATQPALHNGRVDAFGREMLRGLGPARELAPDPDRLHRELKRVDVSFPTPGAGRRSWEDLAGELGSLDSSLCIVNRRDDAAALWALMPEGTLHLSARMCGAHRAVVISDIRRRLAAGETVRVISTQLVEAGVDLDFPVVYRAMAGLDSIAQAAGRCNREGKLAGRGRVIVFDPPRPSPTGLLLKAEQSAKNIIAGSPGEPLTPAQYTRYFEHFYASVNSHDTEGVLDLLQRDAGLGHIQFRSAASRFRLIPDEGQRPVVVRWGQGESLIGEFTRTGPNRDLLRRMQRYMVTLYASQWKKLRDSGDLALRDELLVQSSAALYHPTLGLLPELPDYAPDNLIV